MELLSFNLIGSSEEIIEHVIIPTKKNQQCFHKDIKHPLNQWSIPK